MKIDYSTNEAVTIAVIHGRLDGTAPALLRKELPLQLQKTPCLVLDCTALEYMDSGGLGALLACLRIAVGNKGDIRLAAINAKVKMLMELTRADKVFQIYTTVADAVTSYTNQGSRP